MKYRTEKIRGKAQELGFADCGFSRAEALPDHASRLRKWLDRGRHAGMSYMARHFEKRCDPTLLFPGAKSVISLLFNYFTNQDQTDPKAPVLSKYAYGEDYHFVLKDRMKELLEYIRSEFGQVEGRTFVDSAPVLDRAWAVSAGLGWIGKNSNLISRKHGSFVFIGELILDLELDYNQVPENDFCGSCNRCIEACPTGAILSDRTLDAGRCISYLTIEHRDPVPEQFNGKLGNRFFGCDICQDVCPWNRKLKPHMEQRLQPRKGVLEMTKEDWENLEEESFDQTFRDSPLRRAGFNKIRETLSVL